MVDTLRKPSTIYTTETVVDRVYLVVTGQTIGLRHRGTCYDSLANRELNQVE